MSMAHDFVSGFSDQHNFRYSVSGVTNEGAIPDVSKSEFALPSEYLFRITYVCVGSMVPE